MMSTEANKQVIRAFFAALCAGDMETACALLHQDVIWTIIGATPVSRTFRGVRGFAEELMGSVFRQIAPATPIRVDIIELIAEGDKVVARAQGTIRGRYGPYNNTYCHVFTVRDGRIIEDIEYLDTLLIEQALYGRRLTDA
jgi:uncharacterized protein